MSILTVQQRLKAAGFDPGPVDGKWGPKTEAALNAALAPRPSEGSAAPAANPNDALLVAELLRDEGFVSHAYQDSLGFWTIGIGRLIDKRKGGGITREEAEFLKANDIARFKAELDRKHPWWRSLDPVRQRVILNMTFNMGSGWLDSWPNTVKMIRAGDYAGAASAMLTSTWAKQVKSRATRLAEMMRTGKA
ncbi:MAG: glycoside hydrolase family protein [Caulobacter sp.]